MATPDFPESEKKQIRESIRNLQDMLDSNSGASASQKEKWRNEIKNLKDRLTWSSNPNRGF